MYNISQTISKKYGCADSMGELCSNTQLAVIQWMSGNITRDPPLEAALPAANSTSAWGLAYKPWELSYFVTSGKSTVDGTCPMDYQTAKQLLTYQYLFSQTKIQLGFIYYKSGSKLASDNFTRILLVDNPYCQYQLVEYFRYLAVEYSWGGLTINQSMHSYLFGWTDPILTSLKEMGKTPFYFHDSLFSLHKKIRL